nr:hypothetical protein [Tanacetum cinerariifolium]
DLVLDPGFLGLQRPCFNTLVKISTTKKCDESQRVPLKGNREGCELVGNGYVQQNVPLSCG